MPLAFRDDEAFEWEVRKIAVVGPGIVGMPMAALLARAGIREGAERPSPVVVIQRDSPTSGWKVEAINRGRSPIGGVEPDLDGIVREAVAAGAGSIAYTYVEPTVFLEYALDTASIAHEAGLRNVFVTNGYETPEALELLAPVLDAANVDLKSFDDRFYRRVCGARLEPVKETLVGMRRLGIWVEVTTLVIPGLNDGRDQLVAAAEWIARELGPETPWHLSRFYPAYRMPDAGITPVATLREAATIGRAAGLRHVYVGNVPGEDDTDTVCGGCGELLIARSGYRVTRVGLRDGACARCGRPLAGIGLDERAARR